MDTIRKTTKCGEILGIRTDKGLIFQGIPYAHAERFELPRQITSWDGVFDGTSDPIEAPQMSTFRDDSCKFYTKEFRSGVVFQYAEDPITLTIVTPLEAENCPVLFHIHGGSFFVGKSIEDPAGTSFEYADRGIILVNISYRLNVFGLYRSANYQLYDQLTAFQWVRDNISDYGGNPENITLIGESSGAMNIFQHMYHHELDGKVKAAVLMSGAGFFPRIADGYTMEGGKAFWDKVMQAAGCRNEAEIKKVSAEKLWTAWDETKKKTRGFHTMEPGIDGRLIPCRPGEIRKSGKMIDIPLLIGVTSQDMMIPAAMYKIALDFCRWSVKHGRSNVYAYYFDRTPPGNCYKAFHSCDMWYMFGNMKKSWRPFGPEDEKLKTKMIDSVAQFVKTGDAGWEPAKAGDYKFRYFNTSGSRYISPWKCYAKSLYYSIFDRGPF